MDQRTGLPVSLLAETLAPNKSSFEKKSSGTLLSRVDSSQSIPDSPLQQETKPSKRTYTKNLSKSRELNTYLSKNAVALTNDLQNNNNPKIPDFVPSTSLQTEKSISDDLSSPSFDTNDRNSRTSTRSYGSRSTRNKPLTNDTSSVDITNRYNSLDIRKNSTEATRIDATSNSNSLSSSLLSSTSINSKTTSSIYNKIESPVSDLFSSDFNEEEIIDRTLVDYGSPSIDSGAESNGPVDVGSDEGIIRRNKGDISSSSNNSSYGSSSSNAYAAHNTYKKPHNRSDLNSDNPKAAVPYLSASNGDSIQGATAAVTAVGSNDTEASMLRKTRSLPSVRGNMTASLNNNVSSGDFLVATAKGSDAITSSSGVTSLPRKRSIFKSRVVQEDGGKKRAIYNHKWHSTNEDKDEEANKVGSKQYSSSSAASTFDDFDFDSSCGGSGGSDSLQRVQSWSGRPSSTVLPGLDDSTNTGGSTVTSVKCNKAAKQVWLS